jgi:hypothetical protein
VVHYARLRVKIFQSLPIPDEQAEADLTRCNRHYSTKAEAYIITVYALAIPAFVIIILGVLALCLWELVVFFHLEQYQLICTLVAMLALLSVDKKIVDRLKNRPSIATITTIEMSLIVVAALCGAALITISRNEIPGSLFAELAGLSLLQGALAFTTAVIAFLIATIAYEYTEVRIRTHYFPDMGIVMELQVLCALSQLGDARWADLAQKRELLQRLEAVAYFSERGLPRRLQTGDAATDEWHREQAKQIAAAFRDLKTSFRSLWVVASRVNRSRAHVAAPTRTGGPARSRALSAVLRRPRRRQVPGQCDADLGCRQPSAAGAGSAGASASGAWRRGGSLGLPWSWWPS